MSAHWARPFHAPACTSRRLNGSGGPPGWSLLAIDWALDATAALRCVGSRADQTASRAR